MIDSELRQILELGPKGEEFMLQVDSERSRFNGRKAYLDKLKALAGVDSIAEITNVQFRAYFGAISDPLLSSFKRGLLRLEEIETAAIQGVTETADKGGMPKRTV